MERPRVAVLMGGPSAEHEISLKSGHGVVSALTQRGWPVVEVVIPRELTLAHAIQFTHETLERSRAEVVFIALHGTFGEDGTIQQLCEDLNVFYTGSGAQASRLGLDKVASRNRFTQAGLQVPPWQVVDPSGPEQLKILVERVQFPLIVKPTNQGSSIGVSMVETNDQLNRAIEHAARYDHRVLIEAFIRGRELTVGILGTTALPVVEIQPTPPFFDYAAKYTPGMTRYLVPATLKAACAAAVQHAGLCAHRALGCRHFSRVDMILTDAEQPVILEVNTIPGLTATSLLPKAAACAGLSYEELCEQLVIMALGSPSFAGSPGR